jgi:hypothetical protein
VDCITKPSLKDIGIDHHPIPAAVEQGLNTQMVREWNAERSLPCCIDQKIQNDMLMQRPHAMARGPSCFRCGMAHVAGSRNYAGRNNCLNHDSRNYIHDDRHHHNTHNQEKANCSLVYVGYKCL